MIQSHCRRNTSTNFGGANLVVILEDHLLIIIIIIFAFAAQPDQRFGGRVVKVVQVVQVVTGSTRDRLLTTQEGLHRDAAAAVADEDAVGPVAAAAPHPEAAPPPSSWFLRHRPPRPDLAAIQPPTPKGKGPHHGKGRQENDCSDAEDPGAATRAFAHLTIIHGGPQDHLVDRPSGLVPDSCRRPRALAGPGGARAAAKGAGLHDEVVCLMGSLRRLLAAVHAGPGPPVPGKRSLAVQAVPGGGSLADGAGMVAAITGRGGAVAAAVVEVPGEVAVQAGQPDGVVAGF